MKAVESSSSYRGMETALRWAGRCAACSFTGRVLLRVGRGLRPVLSDSRSFGTGRIGSVPLDGPFIRPVLALQGAIAGGVVGHGVRNLGAAASLSGFADGNWLRVLGAAVLGLGAGMISGGTALGVVLLIAGLLLIVTGPRLANATAASGVARLFGRAPAPAPAALAAGGLLRLRGVTWAAMLLAAAAGALAGAGPDTGVVLAAAAVVAAAAAVLWRPQLVLLVVAAFPWVDWFARKSLGSIGPLWDDGLLVVGVALVLWSVLVLGRDILRSVPVTLPVLLMVAAAAASIVVNRVPDDVAFYSLRVLFAPILFYFVGFLIPKSRRWVRWTIGIYIATATLLALHGLYQYATGAPMLGAWLDATETGITTRAYSVVQNPNVLGGILAMGALISGSLALSRAFTGLRRIALAAVCVVQLGGLAVTFSRGAWIGFAAGLLAMIVLAYRRYLAGLVIAAVVVWFAAPQVFIQRLLFSFSSTYAIRSSTGLGRLWRWDAALQHIADNPILGVGLGTFGGTTAYMFGYWAIWVDNFYLQMAAEGGLLLLAFFLWLLLRSAKGLVRAHAVAADPYLKALAAGMLGAFVAVAVADFFAADWETPSIAVGFWFLTGLATSAVLAEPKPIEARPPGDAPDGSEAGR